MDEYPWALFGPTDCPDGLVEGGRAGASADPPGSADKAWVFDSAAARVSFR